jgi:carbon-monoxide dehydrogenase medium subunit
MSVYLPESVEEAEALLEKGTLIAGGTHLMSHVHPTGPLVSLRRAGLSGVETTGDTVRVGATTTLTQLAREVPFLRKAVESIASPTIRNMATVGGNLFVPTPHGDLAVCLLALGAEIEKTDGGLVTHVSFKTPEQWFYTKAMRRKQNSASIVTVASDGVRIALGGVAPQPVRALAAEAKLAEGDIDGAAEAALEAADPADDAYASAWYRRRVLPVHVRRALNGEES